MDDNGKRIDDDKYELNLGQFRTKLAKLITQNQACDEHYGIDKKNLGKHSKLYGFEKTRKSPDNILDTSNKLNEYLRVVSDTKKGNICDNGKGLKVRFAFGAKIMHMIVSRIYVLMKKKQI